MSIQPKDLRQMWIENQGCFGRLEPLSLAARRESDSYTRWVCKCSCGKILEVRTSHLTSGNTRSCGCYKEELFVKNITPFHFERAPAGETAKRRIFDSYVASAKKRDFVWGITYERFCELISPPAVCYICGRAEYRMTYRGQQTGVLFIGIDRMDPTQGYVEGNIASCCWQCNDMKGALGFTPFMRHIKLLYDRWYKENE